MKTTIELSNDLFEQAKRTAQDRGVSMRSLFERGLRLAMMPAETKLKSVWPDLSFKASDPGVLLPPDQWRDVANETPGWKVS